jgi:hypothetical protein
MIIPSKAPTRIGALYFSCTTCFFFFLRGIKLMILGRNEREGGCAFFLPFAVYENFFIKSEKSY